MRMFVATGTAVVLALAAAVFATALAREATAGEVGEGALVKAAAEQYFKGQATGDPEEFRKVFHPDSRLFGLVDGKFNTIASGDWIAKMPGKAADDEAQRARKILLVDVAGDMALVKVELDYPKVKFTDYLSMLKIDGKWTVVNKTYTGTRKAK